MKNILLITMMLLSIVSFGKCKKKNCKKNCKAKTETAAPSSNEIWMRYDDTKCANPWNFNWLVKPTTEQIVAAVKGNLEGRGAHILEMKTLTDKDAISCDACTCPSGFHYFVRINKTDAAKLKELKFVEINEVPSSAK